MDTRVLVTGGAGFVGSHLVEELVRRGRAVTVLDDLSGGTPANLAAAMRSGDVRLVTGSVEDREAVRGALRGADRVFHLAAGVGVLRLVSAPVSVIAVNVNGTRVVLEEASAVGAPVLVTSSSEVYGTAGAVPFREDGPLCLDPGTAPRLGYAASKIAAEHLALACARETGLTVLVCRLFNTVGPRQSSRHGMVLPSFIEAALAGLPLTVHGDGMQTRAFAAVEEVVRALADAAAAHRSGALVVNVGSASEVAILDLARRVVQRAAGRSAIRFAPVEEAVGQGFTDFRRRLPCLDRLRGLIGWVPSRSLDNILDGLLGPPAEAARAGGGTVSGGGRSPGAGTS